MGLAKWLPPARISPNAFRLAYGSGPGAQALHRVSYLPHLSGTVPYRIRCLGPMPVSLNTGPGLSILRVSRPQGLARAAGSMGPRALG
jgi:hypothetical protein